MEEDYQNWLKIKKNQKQFNVTQKAVAGLKGVSFIPIH